MVLTKLEIEKHLVEFEILKNQLAVILENSRFNLTYLKLDGSNANVNIDIGAYDLTTTGTGTFGIVNITDEANGYQIDGVKILTNEGTENVFLGEGTANGDLAQENVFVGYHAGYNNDDSHPVGDADGMDNVYVGSRSGAGETGGSDNSGGENVGVGSKTLRMNTIGYENTAVGDDTLQFNTTGHGNTALGNDALQGTNAHAGIGNFNTALGADALYISYSGDYNVAVGYQCLYKNTTSDANVAMGYQAGYNNLGRWGVFIGYQAGYGAVGANGESNTCIGHTTGLALTTGARNMILGTGAGQSLTSGNNNVLIGVGAGKLLDQSDGNVAIGVQALANSFGTVGDNVAIGIQAGMNLTNWGWGNMLVGTAAGINLTTGSANACIGGYAGSGLTTANYEVYIGRHAGRRNQTGTGNIGIGFRTGGGAQAAVHNHSNATCIGYLAGGNITTGSNSVLIGFSAGINQTTNSNRLIIDNQDRGSVANELAESLIYGVFSDTVANQTLRFNAAVQVGTDSTNYLEVKNDGELNLHGTGRVTRHWIVDPTRFKMPAANFPGESFEGIFYTLDFDEGTEESAHCVEHIPYRWDSTTDIEVEVDWMHTGADAGAVVWGLEYKSITGGETFNVATTTITHTTAGNHDENELIRTTFTSKILAANLASHDIMAMRFYRKAGDIDDTLAEDARITNVCFHYIQDKLGQAT